MHVERRPFFEARYDGTTYRQEYRVDPRMLVPGIMLTIIALPVIAVTWPERLAFGVPAVGLVLIGVSFAKRQVFSVSPEGWRVAWSLGPIRRTTRAGPDEAEPVLVRGRRGVYRVWLHRGQRRLELFIEAGTRSEGEAWRAFLTNVSRGIPADPPTDEAAGQLANVHNQPVQRTGRASRSS